MKRRCHGNVYLRDYPEYASEFFRYLTETRTSSRTSLRACHNAPTSDPIGGKGHAAFLDGHIAAHPPEESFAPA